MYTLTLLWESDRFELQKVPKIGRDGIPFKHNFLSNLLYLGLSLGPEFESLFFDIDILYRLVFFADTKEISWFGSGVLQRQIVAQGEISNVESEEDESDRSRDPACQSKAEED